MYTYREYLLIFFCWNFLLLTVDSDPPQHLPPPTPHPLKTLLFFVQIWILCQNSLTTITPSPSTTVSNMKYHTLDTYYPLAQQSCGGDIGSVPYVCMGVRTYVRTFVRSYVHYPLAQQSCGGDIGSVPYVCM